MRYVRMVCLTLSKSIALLTHEIFNVHRNRSVVGQILVSCQRDDMESGELFETSRCRFFWLSAFQLVRLSVCSFVDELQFLLDKGITTCGDARCTRFVGHENGISRRRFRRVPASRTVVTALEVFDGSRFTTQEIIFNRSIAVKSIASSCSINDMMLGFLPPEDARRKRLKKDAIPPLPTRIES